MCIRDSSRTLHACSYLTKEWEWLRCESQSTPAFGPQTAEILFSLMDLGQQSIPVLDVYKRQDEVRSGKMEFTVDLRIGDADDPLVVGQLDLEGIADIHHMTCLLYTSRCV